MSRFWLYLYNFVYLSLLPVAVPVMVYTSKKRGGFSPLRRIKTKLDVLEGRDIWIHCASIGEVNSAKPLIERLRDRVVITTFTDYGAERARKLFKDVPVYVIPFDLKFLTDRFLSFTHIKKLLIYETEIWPSLLSSAVERGIEVYIVSGKITERSFKNYRRFSQIFSPIFKNIIFLGRSVEDVKRAKDLGFKKCSVVGDLKFDSVSFFLSPLKVDIEGSRKIIVWGSTHEGEEKIAEKIHFKLKKIFPEVLTVIAPRHIGRAKEIKDSLSGKVVLRTETRQISRDTDFYIVNTIGELTSFYAVSDVSVVGGTFNRKIGGHNPLEPMALGKPVVIGPYYYHFKDVVEKVRKALIFADESSLFDKIFSLFKNREFASSVGAVGKNIILEEKGVIERILKEVSIES
ncbi:3-deoxy-D-manno-octulosonic acid transferase [Desulfurobacterium atlanticum]|uniref:3-deoxy-D-manno-octulosonic acid transferase n=1 Tax=Desulfurobacterium atlanticum TaxID=240169 RepID=A0A238XIB4_9BACT|nr:glycosyltransferase N-terminal domain-containing protein [Desulfurobacterium atlanticum]SNR58745.1 3-deoxy-D-manno-octulosonic-acid transferase [Desulfurobacterium atlanticum]